MLRRTLTAAALAAALASPAFAQDSNNNPPPAAPAQASVPPSGSTFINQEQATDWRASKLTGTAVYGPDNSKIGSIEDVLIDSSGKTRAVVIGVGGFLGVGQKNIAIPFEALSISRKPDSASIDKASVTFTKDQLQSAPTFAYYEAPSSQTTGSAPGGLNSLGGGPGTMKR